MGHIQLSRAADLIVVAPASADILARMAAGIADDLATTLLLATDKPVLAAPAMNVRMWQHPATVRNVAHLAARGVHFVGPGEGEMACHEFGPGRLAEPPAILAAIAALLSPARPLAGCSAIVTSGPTHEPIDPVRYIANRSSGRQGHAIAAALASAGAAVTLVHGPVELPPPPGVTAIAVQTAEQMHHAVMAALPATIFVAAAAVGDWRIAAPPEHKLKKSPGAPPPTLTLLPNPDILASVAAAGPLRPALVIGFAAETEALLAHAQEKRTRKGCDWLVANQVGPGSEAMGGQRNAVHLITADGIDSWPLMPKTDVAGRLVARIAAHLERA
jgi:phosphopantothenoylcysteine decarboxylase/phosphopantothenate--cysteine ligase